VKNLRGAYNFMIGRGFRKPRQLPAAERDMLHRWYNVTPADYAAMLPYHFNAKSAALFIGSEYRGAERCPV
jgi:hypothetical protein